MLDTSDFLQADDINKVIKVAEAVNNGYHSDDSMENYIGVNSAGRQGRYYRLAAEKLGLVDLSGNNYTTLTQNGRYFLSLQPQERAVYLRSAILNLPVFIEASIFISENGSHISKIRTWFINKYPGEYSTADRRFSTFIKYMQYCGFNFT